MEAAIFVIFGFAIIVIICAVIFTGWLMISVLRLIGRAVGFIVKPAAREFPVGQPPPHLVRCGRANCRADNPKEARFCRRCGKGLQLAAIGSPRRPETTVVRRAAMW